MRIQITVELTTEFNQTSKDMLYNLLTWAQIINYGDIVNGTNIRIIEDDILAEIEKKLINGKV